jgi:hypothetical protein
MTILTESIQALMAVKRTYSELGDAAAATLAAAMAQWAEAKQPAEPADVATRKLTDKAVTAAKPQDQQYKIGDGGGLCVMVSPGGSKWWRRLLIPRQVHLSNRTERSNNVERAIPAT